LFETVVALRKARPHMVQSSDQYIFAHNVVVDSIMSETLPASGLDREVSAFLQSLVIPANMSSFDVGTNGRRVLALGEFNMVTRSGGRQVNTSALLVICNDVVMLAKASANGKYILVARPTERNAITVENVDGDWDEHLFKVSLGSKAVVLEAISAAHKHDWLRRLKDLADFRPTKHLRGERLIPRKPSSRREVLQILGAVDPASKTGRAELTTEFDAVPKFFDRPAPVTECIGDATALQAESESDGAYVDWRGHISLALGSQLAPTATRDPDVDIAPFTASAARPLSVNGESHGYLDVGSDEIGTAMPAVSKVRSPRLSIVDQRREAARRQSQVLELDGAAISESADLVKTRIAKSPQHPSGSQVASEAPLSPTKSGGFQLVSRARSPGAGRGTRAYNAAASSTDNGLGEFDSSISMLGQSAMGSGRTSQIQSPGDAQRSIASSAGMLGQSELTRFRAMDRSPPPSANSGNEVHCTYLGSCQCVECQ